MTTENPSEKKSGHGFKRLQARQPEHVAAATEPSSPGHQDSAIDQPQKPRLTPRQPIVSTHGGGVKSQRIYIDMPSSKTKADCAHMMLDPAACIPSKFNIRDQSLLTRSNQEFMALVDAIEADGQRDPVLARPVVIDGIQKYEVIYGTRRRAAVEYLSKSGSKDIKLRAWVSADITDADARQLAMSENADRQDVSPWEKAKYIQAETEKNASPKSIAESIRVAPKTVYRYLQIAGLPVCVVSAFSAPSLLTVTGGCQIASVITKLGVDPDRMELLSSHFSETKAKSAMEVVKAIQSLFGSPKKTSAGLSKKKAVVWKSEKSKAEYSVRPHKTEVDTFTMSIKGVSGDGIQSILEAIQGACDRLPPTP